MGFFDIVFQLPLWIILIGLIIFFALIGWTLREYRLNQRYCPERGIIIQARLKGIPVVELTDIGSGNSVWELGTKKNVNDIKFDTKYSGIRIDPVLTSVGCEPKRFGGGLDVYCYAFENWLPQTHRNHLAFKAIIEYFHSRAKDLEFLTDIEFVSLLSTPETHLVHDLNIYVSKYFKNKTFEENGKKYTKMVTQYESIDQRATIVDERQTLVVGDESSPTGIANIPNPNYNCEIPNPTFGQMVLFENDISMQDLVDRIQAIKRDITSLPIAYGWYAGTEAFKNNAYGYSAQDLEMLLIIHDKLQLSDMLKKINMMIYVIAALIVMVGGAIAFYIVSIAANQGKK